MCIIYFLFMMHLFLKQTYGIHHKRDGEIELITYVDYVEYDGPAFRAGMRPGNFLYLIYRY